MSNNQRKTIRNWEKIGIFLTFLITSAVFLFFPHVVFGSAPIIQTFPNTITVNSEYLIEATMSGLPKNSTYHLRLTLSKLNTSEYFGSTWNGTIWYNGTPSPIDYAKFFTLVTDGDGSWFGAIKGQIEGGDPNYQNGSGDYILKLGRYTESGTTATWSDYKNITLIDLRPTSSPTPTPTDEPDPTNTSTPNPTSTPIPTSTPTKKPTPTLTPAPTTSEPEILGETTDILNIAPTPVPESSEAVGLENKNPISLPIILIGLGALLIIISLGLLLLPKFNRYNGKDRENED